MTVNIKILDPSQIQRQPKRKPRLAFRAGGYTVTTRPFILGQAVIVLDKDQTPIYERVGPCEKWLIEDGFKWLLDNEKIKEDVVVEKGVVTNG